LFVFFCALLAAPLAPARAEAMAAPRERILLDAGWRFALGHASDPARDFGHATGYFSYLAKTGFGDGPASPAFDDRGWRQLDLPHDWAVELPFDRRGKASHGYRPLGQGFPETSIGWYRHTFTVPASDLGRRLSLEFDGVYRNARVFVNGFLVGEEPSGYLGTGYDVTDYLNYGGDNVIAVRVDATMEEGWFYEGAGIYRRTWPVKAPACAPRSPRTRPAPRSPSTRRSSTRVASRSPARSSSPSSPPTAACSRPAGASSPSRLARRARSPMRSRSPRPNSGRSKPRSCTRSSRRCGGRARSWTATKRLLASARSASIRTPASFSTAAAWN
jgi:hypothetical protein